MDFRQNMYVQTGGDTSRAGAPCTVVTPTRDPDRGRRCLYDLANDVIIDKTGFGVRDIRARALRLSSAGATGEGMEEWAVNSNITPGFKELRYVKFVLRALAKGQPLQTDAAERDFVLQSLRAALASNADTLRGFWFGYALEAQLKSADGVASLRSWVCEHGSTAWWEESWVPLVRACASPPALAALPAASSEPAPLPSKPTTAALSTDSSRPQRRRPRLMSCLRCPAVIEPSSTAPSFASRQPPKEVRF
jgi:hypothetical protein